MSDNDHNMVSMRELEELTGIRFETIRNYKQKGVFTLNKQNRVDYDTAVTALYDKGSKPVRATLEKFFESEGDDRGVATTEDGEPDFNNMTTAIANDWGVKLKAEQLYIETQERKLASVDLNRVVVPLVADIAHHVKKALLNFANQINDRIEGKEHAARKNIIDEEINVILNKLSVDIAAKCVKTQKATKKKKYYTKK